MTTEERVRSLHAKMDALRLTRERRKTGFVGAVGVLLAICLILLIFIVGGIHPGGTANLYSGATMLFADVGGYVLVAIIAFTAAVIITVLCIRLKERNDRAASEEKKCSDNHYEEDEKT